MIKNLSISELEKRIKDGLPQKTALIDVRTPEEFASIHIKGAMNIPHQLFAYRYDELEDFDTLILYCRSGCRAETVCEEIELWSHKELIYVTGTGWEKSTVPLISL